MTSLAMPRFYNGLHVLVLPSRTMPNWKEQFGRVLIEAMACGVPVVGSSSGESPHIVGEGGLVFPEGDVSALRAALQRLRADPLLRASLAEAGRQRVLQHYTQSRIAAETVAVYRELMER
jgi:glycosyltransferase involved in cell wall biosynthesis